MQRFIFLTGLLVLTGACSQPDYRASVSVFGASAQTAAEAQEAEFAALAARQTADIREDLAQRRVALQAAPGCSGAFTGAVNGKVCFVQDPTGAPVPKAETFRNIAALNAAFSAYAQGLVGLAADQMQDETAFNSALIGFAASIDELSAVVRDVPAPTANSPALKEAATVGGLVLNAVAGAARANKLRQIIRETNPLVQDAVAQLNQASGLVLDTEIADAFDAMQAAQSGLQANISSGKSTATIAKSQADLIDKVSALRTLSARRDVFAKLGEAHAALAASAESGLNDADFKAAILELVTLINAIAAAT